MATPGTSAAGSAPRTRVTPRSRERRGELLAQARRVDGRLCDDTAPNHDDRYQLIVARAQLWICIDVALDERVAQVCGEAAQLPGGVVTEPATRAGVQDHFARHVLRAAGRVFAAATSPPGDQGCGTGRRSAIQARPIIPINQVPIDTTCGKVSQFLISYNESLRR